MADDITSKRAPGTLDDVMHNHLGINKRDTASLLHAAKIAPDQCLQNHHFQDVMNALIQVSVEIYIHSLPDSCLVSLCTIN